MKRRILPLLSVALLFATAQLSNAAAYQSGAANSTPNVSPKEPIVGVLELRSSKELKFAGVSNPDLSISLTIENKTRSVLKNVEVVVTALNSPAGDSSQPNVDPMTPFDVAVGIPQAVKLKVRLLNAGTYAGTVRILQRSAAAKPAAPSPAPAELLAFTLEIARATAAPPISINDIVSPAQTSGPLRSELHIPLGLTLYSTGDAFNLSRPVLDDVTRKPKADSAAGSLASAVKLIYTEVPESVAVLPGIPTPLKLKIDGIDSPGRYDGTIRFAPAGFQPLSKTFTIYVRDPYWVALFFIALGVVLSLVVLIYGSTVRPRLVAQQRVTGILLMLRTESARAAGDAEAEALVSTVRKNVKLQWDDAQKRGRAITTELDTFDLIAQALGSWIQAHKQLREVRPKEVRDELMPTLDTASVTFGNPNPDLAKVKTAIEETRALPQKIQSRIKEKLKIQLADLAAKLAQYTAPAVHEVSDSVQRASEKLAHGDIVEAIRLAEAARLQYAIILADELIKRVSSSANLPKGMTQDDWDALKRATTKAATNVSATRDPDEAAARLSAAAIPYVTGLSNSLGNCAAESITDEAKRKPVVDAVEAAKAAVLLSVAEGLNKLDAAARLFGKAIGASGKTMGLTDSHASLVLGGAGGPALDIFSPFGFGPGSSDLDQPEAAKTTARQLERSDLIVSAIVVVAACFSGIQLLWVDNPTWGGPASYLAAFLWGFAIDQFSHAGVAALRK